MAEKAGRPEGSIITPKTILRRDMMATGNLNRKMRKLTESLVAQLQDVVNDREQPIKVKLEVLSTLTQAMMNQAKSLESAAKLLTAAEEMDRLGGGSEEDATPESILNSIVGGKK